MSEIKKLLEIANQEVGYLEKSREAYNNNVAIIYEKTEGAGSDNITKYAKEMDDLNVYNGKKQGYPWCNVFVDWLFVQAFGKERASQLLIGWLKDETNFFPLSLIHFEDKNELYNYYSKLKKINFQTINKELKENNNKIYDKKHTKEVGILFNLEKRNDEKKRITPICGEPGNNFENKENNEDIIKKPRKLLLNKQRMDGLFK